MFSAALAGGVSNVSFSELSGNLGRTMYEFKFRIPAYYTLLVRSLSVLEVRRAPPRAPASPQPLRQSSEVACRARVYSGHGRWWSGVGKCGSASGLCRSCTHCYTRAICSTPPPSAQGAAGSAGRRCERRLLHVPQPLSKLPSCEESAVGVRKGTRDGCM